MSKVNWGDWYQHFPPNPFIGAVAPHPQIIEYDLVGQYHGDAFTPWVCADFLQQQMQYGITKQAKGVIARVDWSGHVYGSANEFNAIAFAALAKDPFIDLNSLWTQWASEKYSPEAAPHVISALKRSNDIANMLFFTLGFKIIQLSGSLRSLSYMEGARIMHSLFCRDVQGRWRPELIPIANEILNPTRKTVDKVIAEKEHALELIDASLKDLEKAQPYLTGESYVYLTTLFHRAKLIALSWRWITEAYFCYLLLRTGDHSQSDALDLALENVLKLSEKVEDCFAEPIYLMQPERMRNFIHDIKVLKKPPVKWIANTNLQSMRKPLLIDMDLDGRKEVIVNAQDNAVHAFREPGIEVWNHNTFGLRVWYPNISDPRASDLDNDGHEEFMIGAADGGLYVFDQNGNLFWKYITGNGILAAPVVVKNKNNICTIVCASLDSYLYGLDKDGQLLWKIKTGGLVHSNPITVDSTVYLVTQEGTIKAFSASGKELWMYHLPDKLTGALALHEGNGKKFISVSSGSLLTFLNLNGTLNSSISLDDEAENIVVATQYGKFSGEDVFFTGTDKGNLYIFRKNGDVILRKELGKEIRTSINFMKAPMVSVFLLGVDNAVVALNTKGEEIWRFTAAHDALIGNDLLIYEQEKELLFTAQDRKLYVLDIKSILSQRSK
jgi:outer membrane protein assembly factor BamB